MQLAVRNHAVLDMARRFVYNKATSAKEQELSIGKTKATGMKAGCVPVHSTHRILAADARSMSSLAPDSVDLIVTSPPYPMIAMWDRLFSRLNPAIATALRKQDGSTAFELMHHELDAAWRECHRVLKPGGFACINVGDAVRTMGGTFQLFPNHARIGEAMRRAGFISLPDILWRKQTNAPNKFMGSGMLPAGAYVTYEHEYILVFRKGGNRVFSSAAAKALRRHSAFFWEERNVWFSDVWTDLKGTVQKLTDEKTRSRSGAFPFELAFRLILMYSLYGDTVLDPFLGTGTTSAAALAACRNSVGIETDTSLLPVIAASLSRAVDCGAERVKARLAAHRAFVAARTASGRPCAHRSRVYGCPVMTAQETELTLYLPASLDCNPDGVYHAAYVRTDDRTVPCGSGSAESTGSP